MNEHGKYSVIYADPPWHYRVWSKKGAGRSAESHYSTMSLEDINRMPLTKKLSELQRVRAAMILSWHCQTVMIPSLARAALLYPVAKNNGFRLRGLS